ncbi:RcnB family protein [Flavisphingomonas formosensis]|uniref:RcnB family protein n=1 Tax=Flavisphingomonas formosensis TaxID=861534 RepID=UPI0012F7113D|nr:RcnB family protein [Sphingomonas formosensis]
MKKMIAAALAATTIAVATPAMAAPHFDGHGRFEQRHDRFDRRGDRFDRHNRHDRVDYRRWNRGDRFDYRYARNYRVIGNPHHYRLYDAPRGYRWVRSGNDAVLVGITTGIIAAVMANSIY